MAGEWYDSAPVVDDTRPAQPPRPVNRGSPLAQALAGPAESQVAAPAPRAPQAAARAGMEASQPPAQEAWWEAAPVAQAPAAGAAQIPGQAPDVKAPAATRAPRSNREPTVQEKVVGGLETALSLVTNLFGGTAGMTAGFVQGMTEDLGQMVQGNRPDPGNLDRRMQAGSEALTYAPRSEAGQEYVEDVGGVLNQLPAYVGHIGPAGAIASQASPIKGLASDAARSGAQKVRTGLGAAMEAVRPAEKAAAGTKASAGAAGTDMATQRRERAAALPVPIKITKGQAERNFEQQRFEKETAKDVDLGKDLRENADEQNARVIQNLETFEELTGRQETERGNAGRKIIDPLERKAEKKKAEIRADYQAARAAGELEEPVDTTKLVNYLEKNRASAVNAGVLSTAESELVRLGGATRDADGKLMPGAITLNDIEELRKVVGTGGKKDATNSEFAGQLRNVIDSSTEGAGGELYKTARKKYADFAGEFKNQGVVRDLLNLKKNTTDRTVAFDNVFKRVVLSGDPEDLRTVKRSLLDAGEEGKQAYRELQGQAMKYLREEATGNSARDQRGNPIVSADKFSKALKQLDRDGRLEDLVGKRGAAQLRDVDDLLKDIYTAPPGAVNTSNTAQVLIKYLADTGLSALGTGVPLPLIHGAKAARDYMRTRTVRKQVRDALGPDDPKLLLRKADSDARPFDPIDVPMKPGRTVVPREAAPKPAAAPVAPAATDPRIAEIERLREGASPETLKVLDEQAKRIQREQRDEVARRAREAEADRLEQAAAATENPELRAALQRRATEVRPEKIPTGEAKELTTTPVPPVEKVRKLPVGQAREIPADDPNAAPPAARSIPVGKTEEILLSPEDEAQWRAAHGFGTLDADRAKAVAKALETDAAAVRAAVVQHQQSPRAFDRQIQRIVEEGAPRESQPESTPGSSRGLQPSEDGQPGSGRSGQQGEAVGEGRAAPEAQGQTAEGVARAFERSTEPTGNPITDSFSKRLREDYPGAVRQYDEIKETRGGRVLNTDIARELSPDYLKDRTRSADVHEPASAFVKRLYAEKLAGPTPKGTQRRVMFTAGGTGSGKTTSETDMGDRLGKPEIVYDTNMNKLASSIEKVEQALEAGRDVRIFYVYADPVEAFRQAIGRTISQKAKFGSGRTVPIAEHIKTHVGAARVVRELADRYRNDLRVDFLASDNTHGRGNSRPEDIANLPLLSDNGLREQLEAIAREAHRSGRIDDATLAGYLGEQPARVRLAGLEEGSLPADQRGSAAPAGRGPSGREGPQGRVSLLAPARDEPAAKASPQGPVGSSTSVVTERGLRVPVRYRLLDTDQLITSHDDSLKPNPAFPQEYQPRDRSRDESEAQIARIQNSLQPDLLADSAKASDGAPIIGPDGLVESGNARTIALRRAYATGQADGYRDWLADNAERFGLTAEQVKAAKQPVLVRERTVDVDRADFARQANESPVSSMSETEQAMADARHLPELDGLVTNDDGTVNLLRSIDFVRDFMRLVPGPNERNKLMTADGRLSQEGRRRLVNAVFAKAYGDADLTSMLTESTDGNVKNVLAGLLRAAPGVAKVRELAAAGARGDASFASDLVDAVRRFSQLREEGMTVRQYLSQGSLIGGEASPAVQELLRQLEVDSRAPRRIAEMVEARVRQIDLMGDPRQSSLLE